MFKLSPRLRTSVAVLVLGMAVAACSDRTPSFQGSPPLSAVPKKVKTFTDPYSTHVGAGLFGTAILLGPNFLPGRCEGMYLTGDRALLCDQLVRFNGEPPAKPDPNARYRCIRTLGGATECTETPVQPVELP